MDEAVLRLIDAVCEAYDAYATPRDVSGDGVPETFCNEAVQLVCGRLGYDKFKGMVANQMIDYMDRKTEEWSSVNIEDAQTLANLGKLVIAGFVDQPHGHVVVVRPGMEEFSSKWKVKTPKCGNVGRQSYIGRGVNWAFQEVPEFWVLKNVPAAA